MDNNRALIIDDDIGICELLLDVCGQCNFDGRTATNANEFKNAYADFNPQLIILDLYLGDTDGIELLRYLAEIKSTALIILISGYDEKILSVARRLGNSHGLKMIAALQKPVKINELIQLLEEVKTGIDTPSTEQLRDAIDNNEMIVHYQPKINLLNNQITGVESLARWDKGQDKIIMPDHFIIKAEECNLIKKLTSSIVETVFKDFGRIQEQLNGVIISINLSGKDLDDLEFPNKISVLAKTHHVDPAKICFEITETAVMAQPKIVMEILARLRLKGFLLSIDDFGTGYSSLVELRKMPFNEMKIDRSFIFDLHNDRDDQIITRAIIDLGHNLGLTITAEGVESMANLKVLQEYKCDVAQGFFYSHAVSIDKLLEWIKKF